MGAGGLLVCMQAAGGPVVRAGGTSATRPSRAHLICSRYVTLCYVLDAAIVLYDHDLVQRSMHIGVNSSLQRSTGRAGWAGRMLGRPGAGELPSSSEEGPHARNRAGERQTSAPRF